MDHPNRVHCNDCRLNVCCVLPRMGLQTEEVPTVSISWHIPDDSTACVEPSVHSLGEPNRTHLWDCSQGSYPPHFWHCSWRGAPVHIYEPLFFVAFCYVLRFFLEILTPPSFIALILITMNN